MAEYAKANSRTAPPEPVYTFKGTQAEVHALAFFLSSNEEKLLVGTREGKVHTWDLVNRCLVDEFLIGNGGSCISLLTPCTTKLVTHCRGEALTCWVRGEHGSWKVAGQLSSPGLDYCSAQTVTMGPTENVAVAYSAGEGGKVFVGQPEYNKVLISIASPKDCGSVMGLSEAGSNRLAAAFENGTVAVWDLRAFNSPLSTINIAPLHNEEGYAAMCIAYNSVLQRGIVGSSSSSLSSFSLLNNKIEALNNTKVTNPGVNFAAYRKDNKLLATAGWDSRVRLFECRGHGHKKHLRPLAVLDSHTGNQGLQSVIFSPLPIHSWDCECLLVAGGQGCTVCLWDVFN